MIPLVVGPDGERLAKRHGSVAIEDHRQAGWGPEAIIGLLAESLGLRPDASPISAVDLLDDFELQKVPRVSFVLPASL